MDHIIQSVLKRYYAKISKEQYYYLCKELKSILEDILKKYKFEEIFHALEAVSDPENLIVPWDEIDEDAQKDTINLLKGALSDALRFNDVGLKELIVTYQNYENLEQFLGPILDREYTDLYTLSEWGS